MYTIYDSDRTGIYLSVKSQCRGIRPTIELSLERYNDDDANGRRNNLLFAYLPVDKVPGLIALLRNEIRSYAWEYGKKPGCSVQVSRTEDSITFQKNDGKPAITLKWNELAQWENTASFFELMYQNIQLVDEIGRCVRDHMINVLRQIGLDTIDPTTNRFHTTPWYDSRADSNTNLQRTVDHGDSATARFNSVSASRSNFLSPGTPGTPGSGTESRSASAEVTHNEKIGFTQILNNDTLPPLPFGGVGPEDVGGLGAQSESGNTGSLKAGVQTMLGITFAQ